MIRVLVVSEHLLVRNGLRLLLEDGEGIRVVGEADSGEAALPIVAHLQPDVVLMDGMISGLGGLETTIRIRRQHPAVGVVVVTHRGHGRYPRRFLAAGAHGYLDKDCGPLEFRHAVRLAAQGEHYLSQQVAQQMALLRGGLSGELEDLTPAEFRIFLRMTSGDNTGEIAEALFMSPKTVATYRSRIFGKLGVRSSVEATHLALREGLIPIGAPTRPLEVHDSRPSRPARTRRGRAVARCARHGESADARGSRSQDVDGPATSGS
jgi:two-component system invasion response regulator UvrY